jgi:hypothetical protein
MDERIALTLKMAREFVDTARHLAEADRLSQARIIADSRAVLAHSYAMLERANQTLDRTEWRL